MSSGATPRTSPNAPLSFVRRDARLEQRDDFVEVVAAEGAKGAGKCEVSCCCRRAGSLDEVGGTVELDARLVVGAVCGVLPGEHLDRWGGVGDEAELGRQLGRFSSVGEGPGVVSEEGPTVGEHGQGAHQYRERAPGSGVGKAVLEEWEPVGVAPSAYAESRARTR